MTDHPRIKVVRETKERRDVAERNFRGAIVNALSLRRPGSGYTATDVADAAGVSRARVYQILDEERTHAA